MSLQRQKEVWGYRRHRSWDSGHLLNLALHWLVVFEQDTSALLAYFKKLLPIYFWLYWALIAAHKLVLVMTSWGYSQFEVMGFSMPWRLLLWIRAQSTGSWWCMSLWNLPRTGMEPCPLHWQVGFLTTGPPGKSLPTFLHLQIWDSFCLGFHTLLFWPPEEGRWGSCYSLCLFYPRSCSSTSLPCPSTHVSLDIAWIETVGASI